MLKNYFKITLRSLIKNKVFSFINIVGLSIGIAVSMIILLYVVHEFSYDKFHAKSDKIYRLLCKINYGGQNIQVTAMSSAFGPIVKEKNAEIENYVRLCDLGRVLVKSDFLINSFESKVVFADTSFFSIFTFPLLQGDYHSLARPSTVIITEEMAKKYFGTYDVVGKTLTYNKSYPLEVVGVAQNFPSNSTFQYDFIVSFTTLGLLPEQKNQYDQQTASLGSFPTYIVVRDPETVSKIIASIPKFAKTSVDEAYTLERFVDTHLGNNLGDTSNITYLSLFSAVAIIILALALINYMNLTTAQATSRAKEVGIRKVIGARRNNLAYQFYLESTLITLIAFGLALVWIEIMLPLFLNTLQLQIDKSFLTSAWFIITSSSLFLICIFIAGSYPSFVLSRFKPADVLKGKISNSVGGAWVRKGFTIFQFATSIALILVTLGIQYQLEFLRNQKIGLNKEQVMVINLDEESEANYSVLKNELRSLSGISQVAASSTPLYTTGHNAFFTKTPTTHEDVFISFILVDENFISTLEIEWLEKPTTQSNNGYIINEAALEKLKIKKSDLGVRIAIGGDSSSIDGIVKDFNYASLRQKIDGLVFLVKSDTSKSLVKYGASLYVRLDSKANLPEKIASIQNVFRKYQSDRPFEYYFLDDAFNKLYKSEDRLSKIFNVFTAVAIFIACLGLFGLVTFTVESRTKEIGIRKVLGASIKNIFKLLSKDFIVLVLIAVVLSIPFAWLYLQTWLQQFSYRTEIPWWFALVAALIAIFLTVLIICSQAIKAAVSNPVDSLRSE